MSAARATGQRPTEIWLVLLVIAASLAALLASYALDQPMLMMAVGLAPIAGVIAWSQPFLVCALFVAFTYFRLPEAYPFLAPMKPALLLGVAALSLAASKVLLSPDREIPDTRTLRALCLLVLIATIGAAFPFSLLRGEGPNTLDALMIPVIMLLTAVCAILWSWLLSATGEGPLPLNIKIFTAYFVFISLTMTVSPIRKSLPPRIALPSAPTPLM